MTGRIIDLTQSSIDVEAKFNGLNTKLDGITTTLAGLYPTVPTEEWFTASSEVGHRYIRSFKGTLQSIELDFMQNTNTFTDVGTIKLTDFVTGYNDSSIFIPNNGCKMKWNDVTTPGGAACKVVIGLLSPFTVGLYVFYGVNSFGRFRKVKINGLPVDFRYA